MPESVIGPLAPDEQAFENAWTVLMAENLRGRAGWLIRLRWFVVLAVLLAAAVAAALDAIEEPLTIVAGAALLALGNLGFWWVLRGAPARPPAPWSQNLILAQIVFDLLVLTILLELAGSIENPFMLLYLIHMAVAGMLLPFKQALFAGTAACVLHGTAVIGQLLGLVPHVSLQLGLHELAESDPETLLTRSPAYVIAHMVAFVVAAFSVILLIHQVARRQREAEARSLERERIASSLARLARLGALAAGVAHTVRNPLHALMNCVDILRRELAASPASTQEILDIMGEGVDRIEAVTRRLLTLTRDAPLAHERVELKAVVEDALRFVRMRSRESGVTIDLRVVGQPSASVDVARLAEALANLLDNAVYACRAGGAVAICIDDAPAAGKVRITIHDTGEGIAPEIQPRLFEVFFTTKPVGEGSGLGLAIARRAVDEHGGTLRLESRPREGTTVTIELPREVSDHE